MSFFEVVYLQCYTIRRDLLENNPKKEFDKAVVWPIIPSRSADGVARKAKESEALQSLPDAAKSGAGSEKRQNVEKGS